MYNIRTDINANIFPFKWKKYTIIIDFNYHSKYNSDNIQKQNQANRL